MSSIFKLSICLRQILCCFILLKVAFPSEVSVSKPPWPTKVFVPLQSSSVTLICNINLTNPTFEISGNFGSKLRFTNPLEEMILNSHGLFIEELPGMLAVKLTINDTSMNNKTQIECRQPLLNSEDVILTTFLYEQPANISTRIMSEDLELINISWTQVSKTSLPQIFTLTISHGSANEVFVLNESFFTFRTPNNAQTCEIYNFSVTAAYVGATYTGPGCSVPSPVLSKMLPSLPNIDRFNSTLIWVGELGNITVNHTRLDTIAQKFINVTCPPINYLQVIGYDIESDNKSIGPLAVPGRLLFNNSLLCPLINHDMESSLDELLCLTQLLCYYHIDSILKGIPAILLTVTILVPFFVIIIIIIMIMIAQLRIKHKRNTVEMTMNEIYGISTDDIETTPNVVYGVSTGTIETTLNEVYVVSTDGIETTPNKVYGASTDGIETTPNKVCGVSTDSIITTPNDVYGVSTNN